MILRTITVIGHLRDDTQAREHAKTREQIDDWHCPDARLSAEQLSDHSTAPRWWCHYPPLTVGPNNRMMLSHSTVIFRRSQRRAIMGKRERHPWRGPRRTKERKDG